MLTLKFPIISSPSQREIKEEGGESFLFSLFSTSLAFILFMVEIIVLKKRKIFVNL